MNKLISSLVFGTAGYTIILLWTFPDKAMCFYLGLGITLIVASGLAWMAPDEKEKK